jgi:hypothetical protein
MAAKARQRLLERVTDLYAGEQARFEKVLAGVEVDSDQAARLADAAAAVKAVR